MAENIKERLLQFLNYKKLGQTKFEEMCGISRGYIAKSKKSYGTEIIEKIGSTFPELNTAWLISGEGEMLRSCQTVGNISNSTVSGVNLNGQEIHVNNECYKTLLDIVERYQRQTESFLEQIKISQSQMNRLLDIIEKKL